jgi:hypothetical protein
LYLVTKGIAAGAGILAPFAAALGLTGWVGAYLPEVLAMVFTLITTALLIEDLKKPRVFYRLLTRPNMKSWLVKGGMILGAFGAASAAVVLLRMLKMDSAADGLRWVEALLGVGTAGYTAFLFGQCEGRDLWQSKLLLPHLIAQAVMCGGLSLGAFQPTDKVRALIGALLVPAIALHMVLGIAEAYMKHATTNATQGAAFLFTVRLGKIPACRAGLLLAPAAGAVFFGAPILGLVLGMIGLYLYEWAFVRAAQLPPLS